MNNVHRFPTERTTPAAESEPGDRLDSVRALNESCVLYHTLATRITGMAQGWPDERLGELEVAVRDRFADFLVDLPDQAIHRLISLAAA